MADNQVPEHQHSAADVPFMHFGELPVSITGPVYVPPQGSAPALSRFEVSYYPHLMRRAVAPAGQVWVHQSHTMFFVMTDQDIDQTDQATRTARSEDVVSYPDGDDRPPLHTFNLDVPTAITQCDFVVSENSSNGRQITMSPYIIPLNVPATAPTEGDDDGE